MPLKLVDHSEFIDEDGKISPINRIQGSLKYGSTWFDDLQAQEKVLARLDPLLNDRYVVFRNIRIPGVDYPAPIIIAGPPGVQILYPTSLSGFYEARGETWSSLNRRKNEFVPSQPNPTARAISIKNALAQFMIDNEFDIPLPNPVLLFTDAHIHIDSQNPALRMVLIDALSKYLMTIPNPMGKVPHYVVELFSGTLTKTSELIITPPPEPETPGANQFDQIGDTVSKTLNFDRKQWITIFTLVGVAAVLIIVMITLLFIY